MNRDLCYGCGNEFDPDVCWCGVPLDTHIDYNEGHSFVPMGCDCFRVPVEESEED